MLVGYVIGDSCLSARLTTGSLGLKVVGFAMLLQGEDAILGTARQVNVVRSPHAGTKVGGAGELDSIYFSSMVGSHHDKENSKNYHI